MWGFGSEFCKAICLFVKWCVVVKKPRSVAFMFVFIITFEDNLTSLT